MVVRCLGPTPTLTHIKLYTQLTASTVSGHIPLRTVPHGQFPLPFYTVYDISPFRHHHLPIYNIKQSTVNEYKIDRGR